MSLWEMLLLGAGLAMDATAVSMTNGMCIKNANWRHALAMGLAFGLFQGLMPLLGYFLGAAFAGVVGSIDHWVALILLGFIGGKMVVEALKAEDEQACSLHRMGLRLLLAQAVATSIDALAVGVSFAALQAPVLTACGIIAGVTFVFSVIALYIGRKFGNLLSSKAELAGGVILVAIGLKIFIEHMLGG